MQGLLAALATVLVSRPCSEADIYAGWPCRRRKRSEPRGLCRTCCESPTLYSQIELVNIDLNAAEALHLTTVLPSREQRCRDLWLSGIKVVTLDSIPVRWPVASVAALRPSRRRIHGGQNISIRRDAEARATTSTGAQAMHQALKARGWNKSSLHQEGNETIGDSLERVPYDAMHSRPTPLLACSALIKASKTLVTARSRPRFRIALSLREHLPSKE